MTFEKVWHRAYRTATPRFQNPVNSQINFSPFHYCSHSVILSKLFFFYLWTLSSCRKPRTNLRQNITFGTVIFSQILAEIERNFLESCHFDQHGEGETKIYRLLSEIKETSKISIYSNDSEMINLAMLAASAGMFSRYCKVCWLFFLSD